MMIWSTKSQLKSTKSQHTYNTSKCTEFDGGSEFSEQMMIWSTKSQQKVNILIIHQNVQNLTADPKLVNK